MYSYYTNNQNQQLIIALLKEFGIKRIIVSPGGTNPALVASFQYDSFFEIYSCVDERSAAYLACGMAEESGEPVVICCTGATASRNYMPGLTEAFYRKLPIIAITCSRDSSRIGQLIPQITDRTAYPNDIFVEGVQLQTIKDKKDLRDCEFKINKALLASVSHGGGPVHLNVICTTQACETKELPPVTPIKRIQVMDEFPIIPKGKIGIFIGSHKKMTKEEEDSITNFCERYNAVVFCDHTSNYYGSYRINYALIGTQINHKYDFTDLDLLIHMGEISGDYQTTQHLKGKNVWRISEDGKIRITFNKLNCIFEMKEIYFFQKYLESSPTVCRNNSFWQECHSTYQSLYNDIPDLPFSNIWIAKTLAPQMPHDSVIHLAILNSLRSWNFFHTHDSIRFNANVGGFGIDGCTSSLIGASLVNKNKLYFLITGDLAFFYDLNALGNHHIGNNIRILLVNNGKGGEFEHFQSPQYEVGVDSYIAAAGHFGNQSKTLVKNYSENLGFEYLQASNKNEFINNYKLFINENLTEKPIIFEVFTSAENQSQAWEILSNLAKASIKDKIKNNTKNILGEKLSSSVKSLLNK